MLVGVATALAAPLAAAEFTVHLTNGTTFESRYQPRDAEWDAQKVTLLDGMGNIISVLKSDIERIESDVDAKGYGHMLDDTTMAFGWAPNDRGEVNPNEKIATSDVESGEAEEPIYNVNENPSMPVVTGGYAPPQGAALPTMVPAPAPPPVTPPQ
jgi:hypothetical protein